MDGLRITSWNVNGIRNPFAYPPWRETKKFEAMFDILEADIVVMQETKIQRKDLSDDMVLIPGWDSFFSLPKHKKGYSGVAVYTRTSKCCPIRAEEGVLGVLNPPGSATSYRDLPPAQHIGGYPRRGQLDGASVDEALLDSEGRCMVLEFPAFVLLGVYSPAMRDETRTEFRAGFLAALDARVRNLVALGRQVIVAGDLNIICSELDTAGLPERLRKEDMTVDDFFAAPARRLFNQLVASGRVIGPRDGGREQSVLRDVIREFHPVRQGMYTCWETKRNARPGNYGSRIDYILCTPALRSWFVAADIQEGLFGSDHCPVYAVLGASVGPELLAKAVAAHSILDVMNPPGMFQAGVRQRPWSASDLLPLSARLIPEFNGRRNIRDMFGRHSTFSAGETQRDGQLPFPPPDDEGSTLSTSQQPDPSELLSVPAGSMSSTSQPSSSRPSDADVPVQTGSSGSVSNAAALSKKHPGGSLASRKPPKRGKTSLGSDDAARGGVGLAQSSLRSFFKPQSSAGTASLPGKDSPSPTSKVKAPPHDVDFPGLDEVASSQTSTPNQHPVGDHDSPVRVLPKIASPGAAGEGSASQPSGSQASAEEKFIDPFQSRDSWAKLLGRRVAPKCEGHQEPCISLVTKKPGMNCGRYFYICPRPLGPSGEKEIGTPFRCRTFIWSSDWGGSQ